MNVLLVPIQYTSYMYLFADHQVKYLYCLWAELQIFVTNISFFLITLCKAQNLSERKNKLKTTNFVYCNLIYLISAKEALNEFDNFMEKVYCKFDFIPAREIFTRFVKASLSQIFRDENQSPNVPIVLFSR